MLKVSNTDAIRWSHSLGQREKARFLESPVIFFCPKPYFKINYVVRVHAHKLVYFIVLNISLCKRS